jgi:hypothetical protein
MADISRQDFRDRVSAALETTVRLYDELFLFDAELLAELRSGTPAMDSLTKKLMYPSKERGDSPGHKLLRRYVGRMYATGLELDDDDIDPDDGEGDGDEEGDEEEESRGEIELVGTATYAFAKIVLYSGKQVDTEPHLLWGRINALCPGNAGKAYEGRIKVARKRLKHLIAAIDGGSAGKWRHTNARVGKGKEKRKEKISIFIDKLEVRPLFDFRSHADIGRLAQDLRALFPA